MKTVMNILIGLTLIIVILPFVLVYANTHPPRYQLHVPPSVYKADYEEVHVTSEDGVNLTGWIIKPPHPRSPAPAIIMCHGVGANKSDFTELAASLARRGYYVLLLDFRAHGESGGSRTSLGYHEQKDVAAAVSILKNRPGIDMKRIGIYGFSMGGATAILAAARSGVFSAVVADSSYTSLRDQARAAVTGFYRLPSFPFVNLAVLGYELYFQTSVEQVSPLAVIGSLSPVPILIIAGEGDKLISADNGRMLYAAAREPRELWIVQGAGHGGTLAAAGSEYERRVGEFFERHMK